MKKRAQAARARRAEPQGRSGPRRRAAAGARSRPRVVALPVECTLADAETLKLRLAEVLRSPKPVTVDVHLVHRIDTASLQLLAAFAQERRAGGLGCVTSGDSRAFAQAARLLGLGELFHPDPQAPRHEA